MGYTTDFIGHIDIAPSLNDYEIAYLTAFSGSRRFERPGGPYDVPGNPRAEEHKTSAGDTYNRPAAGQPGLRCEWVPCWDGCCLSYSGVEKFYGAVEWLRYLILHFLKQGGKASRSNDPRFAGFTFDHVLDGMVIGCRRDNKELSSITVANNRVREKVLRPADQRYVDFPPLPYEAAIDRDLTPRARRRRQRAGQVLPFARPGS
ncbi:MAG TPA: hypothetical protein VFG63_06130 [Nocardioidaceae bacterium]|nr:hypothetical protein [Nocardioidaceae bacterium]